MHYNNACVAWTKVPQYQPTKRHYHSLQIGMNKIDKGTLKYMSLQLTLLRRMDVIDVHRKKVFCKNWVQ